MFINLLATCFRGCVVTDSEQWRKGVCLCSSSLILRMTHQALTALLSRSETGYRPVMLHRWYDHIRQYNFNLQFSSGKDNVNRSALSLYFCHNPIHGCRLCGTGYYSDVTYAPPGHCLSARAQKIPQTGFSLLSTSRLHQGAWAAGCVFPSQTVAVLLEQHLYGLWDLHSGS